VLSGHDRDVWSAAISPDNHWLVTGSWDSTARLRLWPIQVKNLIDAVHAVADRNLTVGEWELYFPGESYHKTFPDLPGP
jgi:WD40 repeat protein